MEFLHHWKESEACFDHSIWGALKAKACANPQNSLDTLKASLVNAWNKIDDDHLRHTIDALPRSLRESIGKGEERIAQV